jgi:hypothetical protein
MSMRDKRQAAEEMELVAALTAISILSKRVAKRIVNRSQAKEETHEPRKTSTRRSARHEETGREPKFSRYEY